MSRECVTHHYACDCREAQFWALEDKIARLVAMRNEWERDAREHLNTFGQHLPASVECLVEKFDAAMKERAE